MISTLEKKAQKYFIGIELRTTPQEGQDRKDIPLHWTKFFAEGVLDKIPNKKSCAILGLYTDYEDDYTKPYSFIIGCEVFSLDMIPLGLVGKVIPESDYEVISVEGSFPESLQATWQMIWNSNLQRNYRNDYEEYPADFDPKNNPRYKVNISVKSY